ncbi:MAG: hypothetical protein KIT62_14640 [Cyclobacteriaceae bacterium]|nr:hypothetical protein [Cyclobacteriaceae bacterium]
MKLQRIYYLLFIITICLPGCETEPILFKGPYHVRFTNAAETQKESYSKTIQLEVHLAAPGREQDITVQYAIAGSARENIDYRILGTRGSLVIPKGQYFGYIELQLINNANNILRSQDVELTLTSVSDGELTVGQGKGAIGKSFTYTILDDCVLGGFYYGTRSAFTIPVRDIAITSQDCENYRLSNWNIDVFQFSDPLSLTFVDNFDNTLTIPDQEQPELPTELATIRGTGIVNPVTRQITFTITLADFTGQPTVTFNLFPD